MLRWLIRRRISGWYRHLAWIDHYRMKNADMSPLVRLELDRQKAVAQAMIEQLERRLVKVSRPVTVC